MRAETVGDRRCARGLTSLTRPQLVMMFGTVLLAVATSASLLLTLDHLGMVELPGCGGEGACAAAAASRWGTLRIVGWPLSFLGLAYFEAMLVAWFWSRGVLAQPLRWVARLGALCSLLLLITLWLEGHVCLYCLAIHASNLVWLITTETMPTAKSSAARFVGDRVRVLGSFTATFLLTAILLGALESHAQAMTEGLIHDLVTTSLDGGCQTDSVAAGNSSTPVSPGRYLLGDPKSEHHLVIFSDYQCPSCRTIHASVRRLAAQREDLSVSARHFPLCADCNAHVNTTRHDNACQAARVAEAAGLLGGEEAFWKMHDWLFEQRGKFTQQELKSIVLELELSVAEFQATMVSTQVTELLQADTQQAHDMGLKYTPMIFLDGLALDFIQVKAVP